MRKTSQDGGDTTSITSGFENEIKKPGVSIAKTKRNSIKRKVQNFSNESDDGVIEPLLQKDKEKVETTNQSAKYLPSKFKTESEKPISKDIKADDATVLKTQSPVEVKDSSSLKSPTCNITSIHNHMNTNVFVNQDSFKTVVPTQSQILVEIDRTKPVSYNPSPLIFTTAKIHTDSKTKQMEPVQVTPVPILSTLEGNDLKSGVTTSVDKNNVHSTVSGLSDIKTFEKIQKNANSISVGNIKTEPIGNNIISKTQTVVDNKFVSTVVTESQLLSQDSQTIKTLNPDKNKKSKEIEQTQNQTTISNVFKTTLGAVTNPSQCDLSYSSTRIETVKSKFTTITSKQPSNVTDITPQSSKISLISQGNNKVDDNKPTIKGVSKAQESQIDSNKNCKSGSSINSNKANNQISLDNTNLPSKVRESIDNNTDIEKINKLASNRQLHRQKNSVTEATDSKSKLTTKDVTTLNSAVKVSKDSAQPSISNKEKESNAKDCKTVEQSDQPKALKSDTNSSQLSTSASKVIKRPVTTATVKQLPLNSLVTKQSSNLPPCTAVCTSHMTQSSSTASTAKVKSTTPVQPMTTTVSSLSKSGTFNVPVSTNIKTLTTNSKPTESNATCKVSSISNDKSYDSKNSRTSLAKTTTTSTAMPISVSKISNNSSASINAITTISNTTKTNINSTSLTKPMNTSSATALTSSGTLVTSAATSSSNKKKSVGNNDAKGFKA